MEQHVSSAHSAVLSRMRFRVSGSHVGEKLQIVTGFQVEAGNWKNLSSLTYIGAACAYGPPSEEEHSPSSIGPILPCTTFSAYRYRVSVVSLLSPLGSPCGYEAPCTPQFSECGSVNHAVCSAAGETQYALRWQQRKARGACFACSDDSEENVQAYTGIGQHAHDARALRGCC